MMEKSDDVPEKVLESVDESRRGFLSKLIVGTAFAVPTINSFAMSGLGVGEAGVCVTNLGPPSSACLPDQHIPNFADDFTATFTAFQLSTAVPSGHHGRRGFSKQPGPQGRGYSNFGLSYPGISGAQCGTWYMDFTGGRTRFDLDSGFTIWNLYGDGLRYVLSDSDGVCRSYTLKDPVPGTFGCLLGSYSPAKGGVHLFLNQFNAGTLILLGSSPDEKTPFFFVWQEPEVTTWLMLRSYVAGRPSDGLFTPCVVP